MTDRQFERADNGSVFSIAMAAVMLVVAGLGLMVWDNRRGADAPASVLQTP